MQGSDLIILMVSIMAMMMEMLMVSIMAMMMVSIMAMMMVPIMGMMMISHSQVQAVPAEPRGMLGTGTQIFPKVGSAD